MSKIQRQLEAEGRAAREAKKPKAPEAPPVAAPAEPEYCTHGLLMAGTCLLCGRWGGNYGSMELQPRLAIQRSVGLGEARSTRRR